MSYFWKYVFYSHPIVDGSFLIKSYHKKYQLQTNLNSTVSVKRRVVKQFIFQFKIT
jgi:hypothetical protein